MSKRLYLLLTCSLILLSVGTGFAMQQRQQPARAALQALETAKIQLSRDKQLTNIHRHRAMALVSQAMLEMQKGQEALQ